MNSNVFKIYNNKHYVNNLFNDSSVERWRSDNLMRSGSGTWQLPYNMPRYSKKS